MEKEKEKDNYIKNKKYLILIITTFRILRDCAASNIVIC